MAGSDSTPSDAVREQLRQVVAVLRPYAMSSGAFYNLDDVREAVILSQRALERAQKLLNP
jgi:hypothetical protein